ncbi:MAG: cbb3-type cytochrome oxidase assembly protein CcoS [Gammaproteobacteria bacterium]|nr:cbb3-type cytochrome oxidase assembly protein CcoS [Gammaproteobacteria bacterium]
MMSVLYLLIPIGIIFLLLAVLFFFWAIKNGQYDDMESQALKIVIEDHQSKPEKSNDENDNVSTDQNNAESK